MRAAKCRKVIVKRHFVRQIHHRDPSTPLISVSVEEVVMADGKVEEVAQLDALRIMVVDLLSRSRDFDIQRSELDAGQVASAAPRGLVAASFPLQVNPA